METSDIPKNGNSNPRTPAQLKALAIARVKAQEARSKNSELKKKEKATIKLAEKALKIAEVDRKYQELVPPVTPAPSPETSPEHQVPEVWHP